MPPQFSADIITKQDDDLDSGIIPLNIWYAGPVSGSESARDGIDRALGVAETILGRGNLSLSYQFIDAPALPAMLPDPTVGDTTYAQLSSDRRLALNLYFGVDATGLSGPLNLLGRAASIPGPLKSSPRSAIVFSVALAGGSDGVIDSEDDQDDPAHSSEARLLGEAIAHEVLHYLGLTDTLVFQGNSAIDGDLIDSPKCITIDDCQEEPDPAYNIMFPYPLDRDDRQSDEDEFFPREFITEGQKQIAQVYVGVR